ncbi:hypothetical protein RUND412_009074 [Rhizina undulata]
MPSAATVTPKVGFVGLGAMGFGMATHLVHSGYHVHGYDVYPPSAERFKTAGGTIAASPRDAAEGSEVFICVVVNAEQAEHVFFDSENGAVDALPQNATIALCSTVPAAFLSSVQERLFALGRSDINLLDAPISGGTIRAANGTLTILVSGSKKALDAGRKVLSELSDNGTKLFTIPGGLGNGSNAKMINQLLAGVHVIAAAEATALAINAGLDEREFYKHVVDGDGWSWMFENRVKHILERDWTPHSALNIFIKDMGIIASSAENLNFPVPLSTIAGQAYIQACSQGYGREDDAGVVRLFLNSSPLPEKSPITISMISTFLKGIHLATAAEAFALGERCGLDSKLLYDIIVSAAGSSRVYEKSVPVWLQGKRLQKDVQLTAEMAIVVHEAGKLRSPVYLGAMALQILQLSSESILNSGVSNAGNSSSRGEPVDCEPLPLVKTIASLPEPYAASDVRSEILRTLNNNNTPVLVVLDDDPTGTQTCHDIAVLMVWDVETLVAEFNSGVKGFFVLTNSRAFPPDEARELLKTICRNVQEAARLAGKEFEVALRGDSTLRGHFPLEPEVAEEVFGRVDAWILAPFFLQGGRYTIDDVHYVSEGDTLVPAGKTQFAKDASFGYRSSNLRDYVLEKAPGRFKAEDVVSITLEDIRIGGPRKVEEKLLGLKTGSVVIVNAAAEIDMNVFSAGLLAAEAKGKKFLFRTAAAFVSSRLGIEVKPPLSAKDLDMEYEKNSKGGLIVAGSYVPKTTAQLESLIARRGDKLRVVVLDVEQLVGAPENTEKIVREAVEIANEEIRSGGDVLVMTSRKLIAGNDAVSSLKIGGVVAAVLVRIIQGITVKPRYIIAKGGITSSDAASKGLSMKRASVVGQAAPGVPLWRCFEETSRHPEVPYVVFPGNVGGQDTLAEVVEKWALDRQ